MNLFSRFVDALTYAVYPSRVMRWFKRKLISTPLPDLPSASPQDFVISVSGEVWRFFLKDVFSSFVLCLLVFMLGHKVIGWPIFNVIALVCMVVTLPLLWWQLSTNDYAYVHLFWIGVATVLWIVTTLATWLIF